MQNSLTFERYNKDASRVKRGDTVVGMLLKQTNKRWGLYDAEEKAITRLTFTTLSDAEKAALAFYVETDDGAVA